MLTTNISSIQPNVMCLPGTRLRSQFGMATLTVTVLVLITITLMVIFAARVGIFDLRMSANEYRYKEAFAAAEGGLEYAVQQFAENVTNSGGNYIYDPNDDGVDDFPSTPPLVLLNGSNLTGGTATAAETTVTVEVNKVVSGTLTAYRFSSTGQSIDRNGRATISEDVVFRHITGGKSPDVPVISDGSMNVTGNMHVVPNPNASCPAGSASSACAVSVWTHDEVETGSSISTCQIQGFSDGQCPNPSLDPLHTQITNAADQGEDIIQSDNYTSDTPPGYFPPDLFDFLFGVSENNYLSIKDNASTQATSCAGLDNTAKGIVWVTGDCSINGGTIGSQANPVILVIQDGELSLSGGALIYGIIFVFDSPETGTPSLSTSGNVEIRGSLISDVDISGGTGTVAVVWDPNVFGNILNNSDESYREVATIPGSWHDF